MARDVSDVARFPAAPAPGGDWTVLLESLFAASPLGLAILDRELRFLQVNDAMAELDGLPAAEHVGKRLDEAGSWLPVEQLEAEWRHVRDTDVPMQEHEHEVLTPRGRCWLSCSAQPVRAGGEVVGVAVVLRDATRQRSAHEFQRHVLAIVGHDLRNPLAAISGTARVLLRGRARPEEREPLLRKIDASAWRMEGILRDLLDYAAAHAGQGLPVNPRRVELGAVCRAVAEDAEAAWPDHRARCAGVGEVWGDWDPDRLRQAIGNLVGNGMKHGDPNAPVIVRWAGAAGAATVEVENRGQPIPADLLPHLFEPFRRGERGGHGLGLFIAREVARAHGGDVTVRSADGATVFTMSLGRPAAQR